jgi:hypothetical protein
VHAGVQQITVLSYEIARGARGPADTSGAKISPTVALELLRYVWLCALFSS